MPSPLWLDFGRLALELALCVPVVALFAWLMGGTRMPEVKAPPRPLEVGDDVKVFAGEYAGLAGEARELWMDFCRQYVTIRLAGGRRIVAERDDVELA
jgi:hypothetical protein